MSKGKSLDDVGDFSEPKKVVAVFIGFKISTSFDMFSISESVKFKHLSSLLSEEINTAHMAGSCSNNRWSISRKLFQRVLQSKMRL